jgi:hypothetical protein
MRFFVGCAFDLKTRESVYEATREYVSKDLGVELSDRRVYQIFGIRNGIAFEAKVGEAFERFCEPVIAILFDEGTNLYYVCTPNRGGMRGVPYLFESSELQYVADFEPEK